MAKNKPLPKNTPPVKPAAAPKQPQAGVRSVSKGKTGSSWFGMPGSQNKEMLYNRTNYILMSISGILIILGFILMSGGNKDPKVFNEAEIYSFRRITLAPITVITGFIVMIFGILKRPALPSEE